MCELASFQHRYQLFGIRLPRNLCKESRKGLTEGLREYFKIDNKRALEVGYLKRGMGTFTVRKPKVTEGCREVTVREKSDQLTLRAEESGYIEDTHQRQPH